MTGFASTAESPRTPGTSRNTAAAPLDDGAGAGSGTGVAVEWRSVNGRFLDLGFRLPEELRHLETPLRTLAASRLRRGKVECRIAWLRAEDAAWPQVQPETLSALARLEAAVQNWLPKAAPLSVQEVLQWCRQAIPPQRADEGILEVATASLEQLVQARAQEGERLVTVLRERIEGLRDLARRAAPLVPQTVARQQERFMQRWQEALSKAGGEDIPAEAARERALHEAAAYAIRLDVDEELARLGAHLDEIERLLEKGGEIGKRLDFLIQELHREANTLGSKAAALELTQIAVDMKVLVEQMREQVQNIE
jgi:uncharacterized protein (TIGR00255 family)